VYEYFPLLEFCVYCQVEVSPSSRSLVQRRLTLCCVYECCLDTSRMGRPTPTWGVGALKKSRQSVNIIKLHKYFQELTFYFVFSWSLTNKSCIFCYCSIQYFIRKSLKSGIFSFLYFTWLSFFNAAGHWVAWNCKTNQDKHNPNCFSAIHMCTVKYSFTFDL